LLKREATPSNLLHRWCNNGRIQPTRAPGGKRLYSRVDLFRVFGDFSRDVANKKKICYARLSSDHQRENSQVGILNRFYPGTEIIKDIGSGLNFRKKGFISFLVRVYSREVKEIIVLHIDRL
jgi:predicted site-specific integrase-resolvase